MTANQRSAGRGPDPREATMTRAMATQYRDNDAERSEAWSVHGVRERCAA